MVFDTIYQTYWNKIFRLCRGYLGDDDWAKDVAQDTFVSVYNNLSNFRQESAISTWIYRIAVNHCLRQLEKDKRLAKTDVQDNLADHAETRNDAQIDLLYRFIGELKEIDRIIISLELEDVKQAEIASVTGLSESNVRVRIHRIKEQLSQKFKKYEHD
ncbi:RNA polymerase sigma factor [Flavobacterium sp. MAH-1]|uniref:RNA polymerase sigma factor n=1 Tax=Flavobacterium agri TaxID=2743471 RepID=A0A7Y8XYW1_9FLAO|nr:RNA polymerase sigma factor [Flavobacterium agri]NUY79464.1 RNA polymerase sigma factor [Flavobacterium agri]NYA69489.1 RNA polymerase sigma factor [Flavobacterium agri]